jgi:hypothetical protein
MEAITLEELKQMTQEHLERELHIMEMILSLDNRTTEEFTKWYISHPYCNLIDEIREIVRGRTGGEHSRSSMG